MNAEPQEAAEGQPPVKQHPLPGPPKPPPLVVRAWQDAWQDVEQILDAHQGLFLLQGFVGGQCLLALLLWWFRVPGWLGVRYWVVNGLVIGAVLVIGYTMTRKQRQQAQHRAGSRVEGGQTTAQEKGTRADVV